MTNWLKRSFAAALLAAAIAVPAAGQNVIREGEGARRRALDQLELKPFPMHLFADLKDWTNGPAPTAGSLDGRVVLICCWSDWYPAASRAMAVSKRLAEKYGKDGLVVIGVHGPQGWKDAKKLTTNVEGATLLLAHDESGEFRKALLEDQDPDFYLIDRAGQLRFADITTESVEAGVEFLLKESKEEAANINSTLTAKAKAEEAERRRAEAIRAQVDMTAIPEVPFNMPPPEAYSKDKVKWPYMPRPEGSMPEDPNNPDPLVSVTLPDTGYFPEKPNLKGKAVLLYFWHPNLPQTFQLFEPMDNLQRRYRRDLVVIGVMSPLKVRDANNQEYKLDEDPAKLKQKIEEVIARQRISHYMTLDMDGSLINTVSNRNNEIILPWVAVISSDGVMRFGGFMGQSYFRGALDKVLEVDPGIRARRAAEDEFLRSK
jgi:hypothetical protein